MSSTFEDYGLTAADVQALTSLTLHRTILLVFCHGIYTCIFFIALHYIAQSTQPIQKRITLAGIVAFLWSANTIMMGLEWKYADNILIVHGRSLASQSVFFELSWSSQYHCGGLDIDLALLGVVRWESGSHCCPSLCVITETTSVCFIMVFMYASPGLPDAQVNWSLVYYSMTVLTNSLCTFLIIFRVVRISNLGASLKTYRGIIEIVFESAVMYAIVYIVLLGCYASEFYTNQTVMSATSYLINISYSITGIAPTLIIARVMAGHSRPDDSWTRSSLPHLRSPMRSLAESLRFASTPNQSNSTGRTLTNIGWEQARDSEPQVAEGEQGEDGDVQREVEASEHGKRTEPCNSSVEKV
ncbi:hypothetical protein BDZ89DRAFT_1129212 [Hymenopellis radicata]|nr:hypothetical protein BDZ89DRAFT_1129212 [Hymenopellis radicata]